MGDFWALFSNVWAASFFGMAAWQILAGALVILLFLVLRKVFAKFVIARIRSLTQRTKTDLDDKILDAIEEPLKLIPVALGFFFIVQWFALPPETAEIVLTLTQSLIAVVMFWALYNIINPISSILEKLLASLTSKSETLFAEEFINLIIKGLRIIIVAVGLIVVLSQWGINVLPLLTGLGIMGMAVAFAAKDTIENIFGGIKLLFDGTFKRGDWIMTPSIEGTVAEIGIATTKIRTFAKAMQSIPNRILAEEPITNWSRMTHRRVKMTIGVEYRTTSVQIENIIDRIRDYLSNNPDIADPPTVPQMVHLVEFGASSIDFSLYYFTKTKNWSDWRRIRHENMIEFIRIIEDEGAGFAFPSQSIYLESTPENAGKQMEERDRYERTTEDSRRSGPGMSDLVDDDGDGG